MKFEKNRKSSEKKSKMRPNLQLVNNNCRNEIENYLFSNIFIYISVSSRIAFIKIC